PRSGLLEHANGADAPLRRDGARLICNVNPEIELISSRSILGTAVFVFLGQCNVPQRNVPNRSIDLLQTQLHGRLQIHPSDVVLTAFY
ncbi:MAG: hypothetical protein U1E51_01585, partial [Candidatus Binatia bacterium]|nr:hypothetical protein [Candidatus Binatia bacterium]